MYKQCWHVKQTNDNVNGKNGFYTNVKFSIDKQDFHNLLSGSKYQPNHDFGFVTLDITPAWPEDMGEYKCVAVNKWGMDETVGSISVNPSPVTGEPPKFVTQLERPSTYAVCVSAKFFCSCFTPVTGITVCTF